MMWWLFCFLFSATLIIGATALRLIALKRPDWIGSKLYQMTQSAVLTTVAAGIFTLSAIALLAHGGARNINRSTWVAQGLIVKTTTLGGGICNVEVRPNGDGSEVFALSSCQEKKGDHVFFRAGVAPVGPAERIRIVWVISEEEARGLLREGFKLE